MSQLRNSRQLSSRVEVEFHHHPHRFRRFTWWTALVLALAASVWLVQAGTRGEHRIYEAGAVSTPHAMFENDCNLCHIDNMAPLKRLASLSDDVHSVSNAKCIVCHIGPAHHDNQIPMHGDKLGELSCAKCHREHEGDEELARVADRHCTDCHADLQTSPGSPSFALHVTDFEDPDGHPDFKIEELLNLPTDKGVKIALGPDGEPIHHAFHVLGYVQRAGEPKRWQDKARIRFNHQAHLKAMFDAEGRRIEDSGLKGYPMSCADCHQFDVERRYMKPINYEQHCQNCHQLTFDVDKHREAKDPGSGEIKKLAVTVPHEKPDVVRGYLSKIYMLDTLDDEPAGGKTDDKDPLAELRRGFPGRDFEASFTEEQARKIREQLSEDEKALYPLNFVRNEIARGKAQQVLFKENGACALCHDINKYETKASAPAGEPWEIVPPEIPDRWYKHSWFRHDSHRMLSCVECHFDMKSGVDPESGVPVLPIYKSASTGDVLMPDRMSCVKCHRKGPAPESDRGDSRLLGARVDCVECHGYHDYRKENFDGNLKLDLTSRPDKSTGAITGHGSK
jgi:hypothetical protein